jgi:type IX secretion system PorP/SprF family membrane protein
LKAFLLLIIFVVCFNLCASAQDIPLLTQKLTNSFLYNPSVAGKTLGSLTISHRKYWSGLDGSPSTNFISFHTPIAKHRFGFGANLYQDNIGVLQTLHGSAAFAYHIRFRNENSFSMGVSAAYDNARIDLTKLDVIDKTGDELLNNGFRENSFDFSFGLSYQAKYFKLGASANRITALMGVRDSSNFAPYYSGFVNFMLPIAGDRDLLEPIVTYRSLSPTSNQVDVGLYYTYRSVFTLGASYRTGSIISATAAVKIVKSVSIGYSRDITSGVSKSLGSANEFTLRLDFKDQAYYTKNRNSRKINTTALAVRRKTLSSTYNSRGTADQKSKRYKRKVKKNYLHSPNYRMDSSKKLNTMRMKKPPLKKKRRKVR